MTSEQGKLLLNVFADTMKNESETTKKIIRAIPEEKKTYKPDPKAKSAHELAWHIATSEVWFIDGVINGKFSMGEPPEMPPTIVIARYILRLKSKYFLGAQGYRWRLHSVSPPVE